MLIKYPKNTLLECNWFLNVISAWKLYDYHNNIIVSLNQYELFELEFMIAHNVYDEFVSANNALLFSLTIRTFLCIRSLFSLHIVHRIACYHYAIFI